jgi:transposase
MLTFHQSNSAPVMDDLHQWLKNQFAEHKTDPNSGLGKAISYLLRHWPELTLFLRQSGAPLDNNIAERMLKKAILHRKNALFYKTMNGARVGDLFMSLIHTCELNQVNPFDYLTALLRHPAELSVCPAEWMPWNYGRDATVAAA